MLALTVTGLNHRTSPIAMRERLAFPEERLPEALRLLKRQLPEGGAVVLSTCNRVEVYTSGALPPADQHARVRGFLADWHGLNPEGFRDFLYEYQDREAAAHLFRVAASLDSLVVGEGQILGQVHDAYLAAQAVECTDKVTSAMFQRAFKAAKDVRSHTSISAGKVSVSSVAVDLAVSIFMDLRDKTVLVVGAGDTGKLTLKHLVDRGVRRIVICNRTAAAGEALAARFGGDVVAFDALPCHLHRADIVITSTSSKTPILHPDAFQRALRQRNQEPMFVIDIAAPRDVDPAVNELDNVYVYDMDDLQQVADENLEARRAELVRCNEIVEAHVDRFMRWRQSLYAEPTIVSMTRELNAIREDELEKTLMALPDLTDKQREEIAYLSRRIVNRILQRPMTQIKEEVNAEDPHRVLHLVKRLFGIEERPG